MVKIKNRHFGYYLRKAQRIVTAAAYDFWGDDCYSKSSILTLYTLQSLVPFFAFLIGIAKGFGFDTYLTEFLTEAFEKQKEVMNYAIGISYSVLSHLKGGVIAGIGVLFLLWTVLNLLSYIETILNQIWKINIPRPVWRKISNYIAILLICPIIIVISSSLTVYIKTQIAQLYAYPLLETVSIYLLWMFKIFPFLLSWLLFFLLYILMPHTRVVIFPRFLAAIFAGSAFQLWQLIYINAQIYIFSYNVVYGTVAILPLFLIWLQVSWMIALAGAELAAHIENDYHYDKGSLKDGTVEKINRDQLALLILHYCLNTFYSCTTPLTDVDLSKKLRIPLNLTQNMLHILSEGGILAAFSMKNGITGYHPLCNPNFFTIKKVCDIIDKASDIEVLTESTEALRIINRLLEKIHHDAESSKANIKLRDLFPENPPEEACKNPFYQEEE